MIIRLTIACRWFFILLGYPQHSALPTKNDLPVNNLSDTERKKAIGFHSDQR